MAGQVQLATTVVEKDYALGWLLWGIRQHTAVNQSWIFKGGTCLKKCYFETYRFSEDLDFSLQNSAQPDADSLTKIFTEISDLILQESGLEFVKPSIHFEIFQNPRGSLSVQGGIKYRSIVRPNVGIQHMQRIKIDLTLDEQVVLPPVIKCVNHPYSDNPTEKISILAYSYEEVFAEKVRALGQRLRPRDLYDVIHLYRRMDLKPDRKKVYDTLQKKCVLRGIGLPTHAAIETHENRSFLESEWETQLKHQIQVLPDFQSFLDDLPLVFEWIEGSEPEALEPIAPSEADEEEQEVNIEAVQDLALPGPGSNFMDRIRFAAANRFVLKLGYDHDFREIEPYAFARSSDGNLLLRAIRTNNREARTYRWDRIQSIEVTTKTFVPEYQVEITSAGSLPVHQLSKRSGQKRFSSSRLSKSSRPVHVYRCFVCGKLFRRKTRTGQLRPHTDKYGNRCSGRRGVYERTDL